jgi:hypothetical protein
MTQLDSTAGRGAGEKGLKGGALGLVSSVVVGMASTAPGVQPRGEPRLRRGDRGT